MASSVVVIIGVVPVFLLSSLAVLVRADLGFGETQLGMAVSAFFVAAALGSVPSGQVVARLGGRLALVVGTSASGLALFGMAIAPTWWMLVACLVLAGLANAWGQVGANLRLAGGVVPARQGLAFGIKQSGLPLATLAGGIAMPAIALTLGWRWAFALAALLSFTAGIVQLRRTGTTGSIVRRGARRPPAAVTDRRHLVVLGAAMAFGAGAATAMAAFIVEYGVSAGLDPGRAGLVLALGSLAAVTTRVVTGWLADRDGPDDLRVVAWMFALGAVAVAAFPLVDGLLPVAIVTIAAFTLGWGWPGRLNVSIVRANPQAPAAATGITQVGVYLGGMTGPVTFGWLVSNAGYAVAWWVTAACLLIAGALTTIGRAGRGAMAARRDGSTIAGRSSAGDDPRP